MTHLALWIDSIAAPLLAHLARASVEGGIALAAALLLCRAARLPPALKCWLLRLAYLKLLLALVWTAPIRLALMPATPVDSPPPALTLVSDDGGVRAATAATPVVASPMSPAWRFDPTSLLFILWAAGVAFGGVRLVGQLRATFRLRRSAGAAENSSLKMSYQLAARQLGVRRPPPLMITAVPGGPLLLGLLRPAILIPTAILDACDAAQVRLMLAHELAHYRRRDLWWTWLPTLGRILFWFHPLVWLAEQRWRLDQESACDQTALTATATSPAEYGQTLIDIIRHASKSRRLVAVGVLESTSTLKRRLQAMRHFTNWSSRSRIATGAAIVFAAVLTLVPWRLVAKQPTTARGEGGAVAATQEASEEQTNPKEAKERLERLRANASHLIDGQVLASTVPIVSRADGMIDAVDCNEGQRVKRGDVLYNLNGEKTRAALAEAEADYQVRQVRADADRKASKGEVAASEVAVAQAQLRAAAARVSLLRYEDEANRIWTPISGVVISCRATAGQAVSKGQELAEVIDLNHLWVEFLVNESTAARLHVGQTIDIYDPGIDQAFAGKIEFVSPQIDEGLQRIRVKATVLRHDEKLRPGAHIGINIPEK